VRCMRSAGLSVRPVAGSDTNCCERRLPFNQRSSGHQDREARSRRTVRVTLPNIHSLR